MTTERTQPSSISEQDLTTAESETAPDPILITGNRRSGTTLLYNMLCEYTGAHPQLAEVQPLTRLFKAFDWSRQNYERITQDFFASRDAFERYAVDVARLFLRHAVMTPREMPAPAVFADDGFEIAGSGAHAARYAALEPFHTSGKGGAQPRPQLTRLKH